MGLKIIIVEPKYQLNVGYIARVSKNFGIEKLFFVRPRAMLNGKKAVIYAKHAVDLLKSAKIYKDFGASILDCDVVVATTGIWRKDPLFNRIYLLDDAVREIKKKYNKDSKIGIIIGRDDTGLNRNELERCDMLLHIGSNREYPVMNISHALAVLLYAFTLNGFGFYPGYKEEYADSKERKVLFSTFDKIISNKKIRNKKFVRNTFAKIVRRSQLNKQELHSIITALK